MLEINGSGQLFAGFSSPTYTPVPDEFFDVLLPQLSDIELRVLLYLMRRTFGFKKAADDISLKQIVAGIAGRDGAPIDRGAGVSKPSAIKAVKGLAAKGIIIAQRNRSQERGDEPTTYAVRFRQSPRVNPVNTGGGQSGLHPRVHGVDPQETVIQETAFDPSKFERPDDKTTTNAARRTPWPTPAAASEPTADAAALASRPPTRPLIEILRRREQTTPSSALNRTPPAAAGLPADRQAPNRASRLRGSAEERDHLAAYLADFARELGDEAPLASTITRVFSLFQAAQLPPEQWGERLYAARTITQERTAQIRMLATDGRSTTAIRRKNKMPYFLAVLADLVDPTAARRPAAAPAVEVGHPSAWPAIPR